MICSKPVLVSSCRPLERIINETRSGLVFEANNSGSFARQLLYMHQHPDQLNEMGVNGHKAAMGPYAWRHDVARLVEMYNELEAVISGIGDHRIS